MTGMKRRAAIRPLPILVELSSRSPLYIFLEGKKPDQPLAVAGAYVCLSLCGRTSMDDIIHDHIRSSENEGSSRRGDVVGIRAVCP